MREVKEKLFSTPDKVKGKVMKEENHGTERNYEFANVVGCFEHHDYYCCFAGTGIYAAGI